MTAAFPDLMLCNYQSHSRWKIMQKYPMVRSTVIMDLYQAEGDIHTRNQDDIDVLNNLNLTQFIIDTEPEIRIIICQIGEMNCVKKWKRVLTPMGVCLEMKLQNDQEFEKFNLRKKPDILGLMIATNLR